MISRDQRTPLSEWWWTVDRLLLAALVTLICSGVILSLAASPPVAARLGLDPFHFFNRHLLFLLPVFAVLIATSFLSPKQLRRVAAMVFVVSLLLIVVTILFGDIVGFTALSERLDPERVKNLVDEVFERLAADIVSFGGQVDKVIGDAIVALFGAPVALEDDAERAVRAALKMQDTVRSFEQELDVPIRMRIGVNTGEALVGALRVEHKAEVESAIREAREHKGPILIDFQVDQEENVWPMVPAGAALSETIEAPEAELVR